MNNISGQKRTFTEIRYAILMSLAEGQKTINLISNDSGINWRTVENHLIHLAGKGLAREVFSSSYVRIFELTAFGKDFLRQSGVKRTNISDNKLVRIERGGSQ